MTIFEYCPQCEQSRFNALGGFVRQADRVPMGAGVSLDTETDLVCYLFIQ